MSSNDWFLKIEVNKARPHIKKQFRKKLHWVSQKVKKLFESLLNKIRKLNKEGFYFSEEFK